MKIHYRSDLHLLNPAKESFWQRLHMPKCDVLILAGDIVEAIGHLRIVFNIALKRAQDIIYVPGNHEYWNAHMQDIQEVIKSIADEMNNQLDRPRIHTLMPGKINIGGINFVGCTLWTRIENQDGSLHDDIWSARSMPDFRNIFVIGSKFDPNYQRSIHTFERQFIRDNINPNTKNVIITHHVPTWNHLNPQFARSSLNPYFISDMHDIMEDKSVKIWIHGHTHATCKSMIHGTKVLCNPHGHTGENPNFDPKVIVRITPPK